MSNVNSIEEVKLQEIKPKTMISKLPFNNKKCPLILSEDGSATTLFRYSDSGPFVDLFDPQSANLLHALKFSIIKGRFCIFNFGTIEKVDDINSMLDRLKEGCSNIHKDLYNHIINNSLMKQSFNTLLTLIKFDEVTELVPEIYETNKETFRILFFAQIDDITTIKSDPILSLFNCIYIKP